MLARPAMILADFLAWEDQQEEMHEFVDGEVFAMVGARIPHQIISLNLIFALTHQLRGSGCIVLQEGTKVRARDDIFYPDALVTCDRSERGRELIERPTLIAEVLSTSTEAYDRGKKWVRYREGLPTLQTYVLVSQFEVLVEVYRRDADGWRMTTHRDLNEVIALTHPPCELTVADIYHDALDLLTADPD
jgi:Uma2 family endonuclease